MTATSSTTSARTGTTLRHVPALDGLRGLAIAAVLLFHGGHLPGGFAGVDLFFVLSGYLITALLLTERRQTGRIDLGAFWMRRARRLLPAIVVVLVAVAIFSRFIAEPTQWAAIRGDGLATLFYVANWHTILSGTSYGADLAVRSPLEHTWSLAIEEQFYVVWPLVVAALLSRRPNPRVVMWAGAAVAAIGTALMVGLSFAGVSQNTLYLGTHTRMAAVGIGAMIAGLQASYRHGLPPRVQQGIDVAAPAVLVLLLVTWTQIGLHDQFLYRGGLTLMGLLVAVLILGVVGSDHTTLNRVLSVAPLCALGLISYGLYLWHWPIFLLLDEQRTGLSGWPLFGVQVLASLALAVVSYTLVEQPIRLRTWSGHQILRFGGIAAAVAAVALLASAVGAPAGRFAGADRPATLTNAAPTKTGTDTGPATASGPAPVIGIFGDSVAFVLGRDGFAPNASALHVSVLNNALLGCEPLGGITDARDGLGESIWSGGWQNCIDTLPSPDQLDPPVDVAMLMFGGVAYDARIDGTWRSPCDAEYQQLYATRIDRAIATLAHDGTPVVVVRPAPVVGKANEELHGVSDNRRRNDCLWAAALPVMARARVRTIDLGAYQCGTGDACDRLGPDDETRYDSVHYTAAASEVIARWLTPQLVRAIPR